MSLSSVSHCMVPGWYGLTSVCVCVCGDWSLNLILLRVSIRSWVAQRMLQYIPLLYFVKSMKQFLFRERKLSCSLCPAALLIKGERERVYKVPCPAGNYTISYFILIAGWILQRTFTWHLWLGLIIHRSHLGRKFNFYFACKNVSGTRRDLFFFFVHLFLRGIRLRK